jgi:hypothetical protein
MSYLNDFEKIQQLKLQSSHKAKDYSEDKYYYYIKSMKVKKEFYDVKKELIKKLKTEKAQINKEIASMQLLYIMNRSNLYENELIELFKKREETQRALDELSKITSTFIPKQVDKTNAPSASSSEKKATPPKTAISKQKKRKLKKFLFKTYEECTSRKTKEPFYMSKEEIIETIYENNEKLIEQLPKNFHKLGKKDLCKVIFKI